MNVDVGIELDYALRSQHPSSVPSGGKTILYWRSCELCADDLPFYLKIRLATLMDLSTCPDASVAHFHPVDTFPLRGDVD